MTAMLNMFSFPGEQMKELLSFFARDLTMTFLFVLENMTAVDVSFCLMTSFHFIT